ncbi:MAG: tetratricopeptide repeat protein, partial [candidate division NC10 bacterium]
MMSTREQYFSLGLNHFAKMESDEAISAFKKAVDVDANFADAYLALAQAYDQKGMLDDAITTIKRAIELNPQEPLNHTSLSVFYRKK